MMEKQIVFREYQQTDSAALEAVIRQTWHYDELCSPKTAAKLAQVYLYACLANQTYTQVALADGVPVGIIMGKNCRTHRCPLRLRMKTLASVISLCITGEGRKVLKIFGCVESIDKELLKRSGKDYMGELAFFAVDSSRRNQGIGTKLFQKTAEYFVSEGIREFYLFTDTSCNYRFYEHQGMVRRGEKEHTFKHENQIGKMTFFLYDCRI